MKNGGPQQAAAGGLCDLRGLTLTELQAWLAGLGLDAGRAASLFARLHQPGADDFARLGASRRLTSVLARHAVITALTPARVEKAADGTEKFLFRLADGSRIESVLIPEGERHTLCLSSQAGCAMGCVFCLTGRQGFTRNLVSSEIVGQVLAVIARMEACGIKRATPREYLNNLVFMGMGEPLANYDNLLTALRILMDERGLGFSRRRVTVSTCGIVPRIDELGRDIRVNLAVSLHAADDELRSRLMPVNRTWSLAGLLAACRRYPLRKNEVILFEYTLLAGLNDSPAQARRLAGLLAGIPARVNLIACNSPEAGGFAGPPPETILTFQRELRQAGLPAFIRRSRGADIAAACGQLAGGWRKGERQKEKGK